MKSYVAFPILFLILGCTQPFSLSNEMPHHETRFLFGTTVNLDVCVPKKEVETATQALRAVWERFEEIQRRMDSDDEQSDMAKINRSYPDPVTVGSDTYDLLKKSVAFCRLTNGAFDVTVYPLMQLWQKAEEKNILPADAEVKSVKESVGGQNIALLPGRRVQLLNKAARIDVSGIVSGYAADEAVRIFKERGIDNFLVDTGGELFAAGKNCQGAAWKIGVRDPRNSGKLTEMIGLSNRGVSTSGSYEKFYEIRGKRWSRILNPLTGYPQIVVASATVIAPTAAQADALSTALCVLGGQRGIALTESLGGDFAAIIFEKEGENLTIYKTKNYDYLHSRKGI